jgi:hypothetical protein
MKKIIASAFIFFIAVVTSAFAQKDSTHLLEISDDFTEITAIFQKRIYAASSEFKCFIHNDGPFDIEKEYEITLLDEKAMEDIGKNKYFIFETTDTMTGPTPAGIHMYVLIFVNKENAEAVRFAFINELVKHDFIIPSSRAEIKRALDLYFRGAR